MKELLQYLPLPGRRLSAKVWLISLPSALLSFERRQRVPPLPLGPWRFAGALFVAAGLGLWFWSRQRPGATLPACCGRMAHRPGLMAGLAVIAGAGILLRSGVLVLYSLALGFASVNQVIYVEDPSPELLMGDDDEYGYEQYRAG